MLAANIGAGSTVGATSEAYQHGLAAWWWVGSAGAGCTVLALWVGPAMRRIAAAQGLRTVGDYLEYPLQRRRPRDHRRAALDRLAVHPRLSADRPRLDPQRRGRRAEAARLRDRRPGHRRLLQRGRPAHVGVGERRAADGEDGRLRRGAAAGASPGSAAGRGWVTRCRPLLRRHS